MKKQVLKNDIIGSLVFAVIFTFAFIAVSSMPNEAKMWPQFICILGMICCAALCLKSKVAMKNAPDIPQRAGGGISKDVVIRAVEVVAVVAVWIFAMDIVGFIIVSSLALLAMMCIPGKPSSRKQLIQYIVLSTGFSLILWLTFGKLLGAKLPAGFLI